MKLIQYGPHVLDNIMQRTTKKAKSVRKPELELKPKSVEVVYEQEGFLPFEKKPRKPYVMKNPKPVENKYTPHMEAFLAYAREKPRTVKELGVWMGAQQGVGSLPTNNVIYRWCKKYQFQVIYLAGRLKKKRGKLSLEKGTVLRDLRNFGKLPDELTVLAKEMWGIECTKNEISSSIGSASDARRRTTGLNKPHKINWVPFVPEEYDSDVSTDACLSVLYRIYGFEAPNAATMPIRRPWPQANRVVTPDVLAALRKWTSAGDRTTIDVHRFLCKHGCVLSYGYISNWCKQKDIPILRKASHRIFTPEETQHLVDTYYTCIVKIRQNGTIHKVAWDILMCEMEKYTGKKLNLGGVKNAVQQALKKIRSA
jgi:hypothetical protein